jgi:hypothetical protein
MNRLATDKRTAEIAALVEGTSNAIHALSIFAEFTRRCAFTPAMEAGLTDYVWEIGESVSQLLKREIQY